MFIILSSLFLHAQKQELSFNNLVSFSGLSTEKFHTAVSRAGFARSKEWVDSEKTFYKISKDSSVVKKIFKTDHQNYGSLPYKNNL